MEGVNVESTDGRANLKGEYVLGRVDAGDDDEVMVEGKRDLREETVDGS